MTDKWSSKRRCLCRLCSGCFYAASSIGLRSATSGAVVTPTRWTSIDQSSFAVSRPRMLNDFITSLTTSLHSSQLKSCMLQPVTGFWRSGLLNHQLAPLCDYILAIPVTSINGQIFAYLQPWPTQCIKDMPPPRSVAPSRLPLMYRADDSRRLPSWILNLYWIKGALALFVLVSG